MEDLLRLKVAQIEALTKQIEKDQNTIKNLESETAFLKAQIEVFNNNYNTITR